MPRTLLPMFPGDQEERRYFSVFRSCTAPLFTGYYETEFWDKFLLQICHAEPVVHHAVVALASLHESFNGSAEHGLRNDQYGLKQYSKSVAGLNKYLSTAKDKSVDIVLICCILFIAFDSLRGDYDTAGRHLFCGLKILCSSQQDPTSSNFIHDEIVPQFVRLRVQAKSTLDNYLSVADPTTRAMRVPKKFSNLGEARNTLYGIMSLVFNIGRAEKLVFEKRKAQPEIYAKILLEKQAYHASLLEQWRVEYDDLLTHLRTSMGSKDLRGATLLQIHYNTALTMLDCVHTTLQCDLDPLLAQFKEIVTLAKSLTEATRISGVSPWRNLLLVDQGIVAPLFLVATKCRDPLLRREAAHLISSPRREGTWDAQAAVTVAERVIAIEEEGLSQVNAAKDVPESSRIYKIRCKKIDLVSHQAEVVFYLNASKGADDTYTFQESLSW
ncbi:hypothetical protein MMC07_006216 [Pseudocyphellaria aurata]|nr:hypothetical protein [Pseudocyphellaria aurata]